MNALEILNRMKSDRRTMLWMNFDRRTACFHDGEYAHDVSFTEAKMARTDPALGLIDTTDGETLAAI